MNEDPPQSSRTLARNVFHLVLGQVTTTTLTILLTAIIARSLGASDFGLLYLITSIATFAYVFVDWGHAPYVVREVARHPERAGELLGSVMAVRTATLVAACAPAVAITWWLGYDTRTLALTATMMVAWLPMFLVLSYSWIFRGRERMDYDAIMNVALKLITLAVTWVFLVFGGRLIALILASAVAGIITFGLASILYRRLRLSGLRVTRGTALELIRGGAPMVAMGLAVAVQPYIDANVLSKLTSQVVLGWYGAAWTIGGTLVAPATILAAAAYPRLSRAVGEPAEFKAALQMTLRPLLFVGVLGAIGTYLFGHLAVDIVYGREKFGPAGAILQAFAPGLLLVYLSMLLGYAILAAGRAKHLASVKVVAVLLTTGLEVLLIPWCQARFGNGGIGVMFAKTAGELVMVVGAVLLIPAGTLERAMAFDLVRGLLAGLATVLVVRELPAVTPLVAIPVCVVVFVAFSAALGLISRADFKFLAQLLRRRKDVSAQRLAG